MDPGILGNWVATSDCEKHPKWPNEISILKESSKSDTIIIKRGEFVTHLNTAGEVVEKDMDGIVFRTIRLPESYYNGKQIVIGSIWRNENDKPTTESPKGLSIILTTYKLLDNSTLVYEKYGYESEERPNDLMVQPYSKSFPKNYHCVFKRAVGK